jgi:hypothetical protein
MVEVDGIVLFVRVAVAEKMLQNSAIKDQDCKKKRKGKKKERVMLTRWWLCSRGEVLVFKWGRTFGFSTNELFGPFEE